MTIEIKKEYRINGDIWFCIYISNSHHSSWLTENEAMQEIQKIKRSYKRPENETIFSETI